MEANNGIRRITSSAKSIIKICKISGDSVIRCLPFRTVSLASSAVSRENKTGLVPLFEASTTHECFSEIITHSNSGRNNFIHIFDCLIHFAPDTIFLKNYTKRVFLSIKSNAFLKSIKQTYNFPWLRS